MRSIFGAVICSVIGLRSDTDRASSLSMSELMDDRSLPRVKHLLFQPILYIGLSLLLIFSPMQRLQALTLSDITVNSAVGERFYSIIKLSDTRRVSADQILVTLAPRSVYQRMGVDWEYFHTGLIFDVLRDEDRGIYLRIVSKDVLFEPYLDFVISVRWPTGFISKQYTVLLDMPVQQQAQRRQVQPQQVQQAEPKQSFTESKPVSDTQGSILREPELFIPPVEVKPSNEVNVVAPEVDSLREGAERQQLASQVTKQEPDIRPTQNKVQQQEIAESIPLNKETQKTEKVVAKAEVAVEESVADFSRLNAVANNSESNSNVELELEAEVESESLESLLQVESEIAEVETEVVDKQIQPEPLSNEQLSKLPNKQEPEQALEPVIKSQPVAEFEPKMIEPKKLEPKVETIKPQATPQATMPQRKLAAAIPDKKIATPNKEAVPTVTSKEAAPIKEAAPSKETAKVNKQTAVKSEKPKAVNKEPGDDLSGNLSDAQWQALSKPGDTLWAIARRIQAESGGRIIDIVNALFENNKSAFIRNDADRLRVNANLNVTIAQIKAATPASRRSTAFSNIKALANTTSTKPDVVTPNPSSSEVNQNNDGVLSLVTQDEELANVSDLTKNLSNELNEKRTAVNEQLNSGLSKAISIEERMANMLSQYQVLSEKTEQLKALEETLNRNIAEKAQVDLGLASDLPIQADQLPESPNKTEERSLMWWVQLLIFVLLLFALVYVVFSLLKARRLKRRDEWVEGNWDNSLFDSGRSFSDEELTEMVKLKGEASLVEQLDGHADEILFDDTAEGSAELQASLYIAYERYDEAEELLHESLDQQPDNIALKSQLLEVYAALGKAEAFEVLAAQLSDESSDDQINHKIDALRREA